MRSPADGSTVADVTAVTRRALRAPAHGARIVLNRRWDVSLVAPVVVAILVSVAASSAIVVLSARADTSRQAQVKLDDVATDVIQLQNMPWRLASSDSQTPAQIGIAIAALEHRTLSSLSALRGDAYVPELAPLGNLFRANFALLGAELALLGQHRTTRAEAIEPQRFHTQDLIVTALNDADRAYHERAVRAETEAAVGSGAIVLLLLGGFVFFFARAFLAREAAERLTWELRDSQGHLEEAQHLAGIGSWEWDFDTQAYLCSAEQLRLHGWNDQETLTSVEALLTAIDPTDRERVRAGLVRRFEAGETVNLDYQVSQADGRRLIHLEAKVVTDAQGSPCGLIGTCQDVSDRFWRLEAERANREKSEFISRMSHELRTPMNAILGFGQLLRDGDSDEQRRARNVERILGAGEHLLGLINELLEISRIDAGRPEVSAEPGRIGELIGAAVDRSNREQPPPERTSRPTDSTSERKPIVLCIDDNESNLTLIEHILSMRPQVELLTAGCGRRGLELAKGHQPELILLDLNLPDISGSEVLAHLKADGGMRELPVIVLSADATPARQQSLIASGANGYLTKPIDVAELLALVDQTLAPRLTGLP
jgi:CheY-like chemotaxis protein